MSNNYKYEGKPFTSEIAEYFINLQYGRRFRIEEIEQIIFEYHLEQGGLRPEGNRQLEDLLSRIFFDAMVHLNQQGRVDRSEDSSMWEVFPEGRRVFGDGSGSVYCFYDPRDRKEAEKKTRYTWACNIRMTERDVEERVEEQTNQWTEKPRIDLILKTSQSKDLEDKIHKLLKALGRHLPNFEAKGTEWFRVHPDEVLFLYRLIERFERPDIYLALFG